MRSSCLTIGVMPPIPMWGTLIQCSDLPNRGQKESPLQRTGALEVPVSWASPAFVLQPGTLVPRTQASFPLSFPSLLSKYGPLNLSATLFPECSKSFLLLMASKSTLSINLPRDSTGFCAVLQPGAFASNKGYF